MMHNILLTTDSLLDTLNPIHMLLTLLLFTAVGWFSANRFKNTNDFKKTFYLALSIGFILAIILFIITDVPALILLGFILYGLVISAFISNHYFYK